MNSLPANIVFQGDFYLAKDSENSPRIQAVQKAHELGFRKFGGEFLFINVQDLQGLEKQAKKARRIKKVLENSFEETYFSIHAPWEPNTETSLELENKQFENLQSLLEWCNDFVDVINIHAGIVPKTHWQQHIQNSEQKKEYMQRIIEKLGELDGTGNRLCLETLYMPLDNEGLVCYAGALPSNLKELTKSKHIGITVDTAHIGIMSAACKQMIKKQELYNGLFEDEWKEIEFIAQKGCDAFTNFSKKVWHVHCSDYYWNKNQSIQEAKDGAVPGKGNTPIQKLFSIMEKLAQNTDKKQLGVTLEIVEEDYAQLNNFDKTIQTIVDYYAFER